MNPQSFGRKVILLTLAASLPGMFLSLYFLWQMSWSPYLLWLLTLLVALLPLIFIFYIAKELSFQLRTLSSLVEAIRIGDFSLRGRRAGNNDAMAELLLQINQLADQLKFHRIRDMEMGHLLDKVVREIDVAIFAFDHKQQLKLVNPTACQLLNKSRETLLGQNAGQLGLDEYLRGPEQQLVDRNFMGAAGRWQIKREGYRETGLQHKLLFITDLKQVLRTQELQAWRRLIRVLSHEVNNSLSPIISVSDTLLLLARQQDDDWQDDLDDGLQLISERAKSLGCFIKQYSKLTKLPEPQKQCFLFNELLENVCELYPQQQIQLQLSQPYYIFADTTLLEQTLINLVKNAIEAGGPIIINCQQQDNQLKIQICDQGPGIANLENLFVPFYSTKTNGSGIGLVLSRQIIEAHNGSLQLFNGENGAIAEMLLPYLKNDLAEN